jgi:translocon-associated protein subunit alpha
MVRSLLLVVVVLFGFFLGAFADLDSDELRAKFGMDLHDDYEDDGDLIGDGAIQTKPGFDFVVGSDEEEEEEEEVGDRSFFSRASFLQSSFLFTSAQSGALHLGEEAEVLIGLTNQHESTINITAIRLSLLHPMEPTYYYIQNCTAQFYYQMLKSHTTQTFSYRFLTDAMLQPRDYVVVVNVFFEDSKDNRPYYYQAVNITYDFFDAPTKLDTETLFIAVSLIGSFGFILYLLISYLFGGKKSRRVAPTERSAPILRTEVQEEWISHLQPQKKSQKRK